MKRIAPLLACLAPAMALAHDLSSTAPADMGLVTEPEFSVLHAENTVIFYECPACDSRLNLSIFVQPVSDPILDDVLAVLSGAMSTDAYQSACAEPCQASMLDVGGLPVLQDSSVLSTSGQPDLYRLSRFVRHGDHAIEIYVAGEDEVAVFAQSDRSLQRLAASLSSAHP